MNRLRILGHVLLWLGFISAAVAMVANKEIDLLPTAEQQVLASIDSGLKIPGKELQRLLQDRSFADLPAEELEAVVAELNAWQKSPAAAETNHSTNPITKARLIQDRTGGLSNLWSVVPWVWYLSSLAIGIAGVVLLRTSQRTFVPKNEDQGGDLKILENSLNQLVERIERLHDEFSLLLPEQIYQYIDDHCVPSFGEFADARNALISHFGMSVFGEIMTEFASGERFINRAWSAAADGYLGESRDSISRALNFLTQARQILRKNLENSSQNANANSAPR
jgi:hypothetical protein